MILGSHNSWSYLPVRKWWMRPFAFMAKCQNVDIMTQYEKYDIKCFDLRVLAESDGVIVAHGMAEYKITVPKLYEDLKYLDSKGDCYVRVLNEVRTKKQHTPQEIVSFQRFCLHLESNYPNIKFWCGRNLVDWAIDFYFKENPSCEEKYSSVCSPKILDDWCPWLYAKLNNKRNIAIGTDKDILLIDFVDIK